MYGVLNAHLKDETIVEVQIEIRRIQQTDRMLDNLRLKKGVEIMGQWRN